jgi:sigma-B regulation protein RsbU (phosphoserine phosphatase)
LAQGDFSARAEVRSKDEVGQLARAFNAMVPALEERVEIQKSLELAGEIQEHFLPREAPRARGLELAGHGVSCEDVGGDFYAYFDFGCGEGELLEPGMAAVVGDVSGHGVSAGLLMAATRAFLRARLMGSGRLDVAVTEVNRLLTADTFATGHFVTLFALGMCRGRAFWVRAGHDPALCFDPETGEIHELTGGGPALGIMPDASYVQHEWAELKPGLVFLLTTDGVWEARNPEGEQFGRQRLRDFLTGHATLPPAEMIEALLAEVNAFHGSESHEDDVTALVVKVVEPDGAST